MAIENFIGKLEEVFEKESGTITAGDIFRVYEEWDSIAMLTLTAMLDDEYGVNIPRTKFDEITTVQEMYDFIEAHK